MYLFSKSGIIDWEVSNQCIYRKSESVFILFYYKYPIQPKKIEIVGTGAKGKEIAKIKKSKETTKTKEQ